MCTFLRLTGLSLALAAIIVSGAFAQTGYRSQYEYGEARFAIDAVDFRAPQTGLRTLEIYYKIFYDALSYQKTLQGYEAQYEVAVVVEGQGGAQIEGLIREGDIKLDTYAQTRQSLDFIVNLLTVAIDEQDVMVRAVLTDKLSGKTLEVKKELKKRAYWGKYATLSRVEFAREVSPADKESKFNKASLRVIPSVCRIFGGDFDSLLTYYQEIYPGETETSFLKVISRIYHHTRGFVYSDTVEYGEISDVKYEVRTINVANLLPGDYELEVRLEGRRGKLYDKLIEEFELELTAETVFRNDYVIAVEMLKYLATKDELNRLKKAKTPEERRRLWDEFWRARSDGSDSRQNPSKEEYFRRVRHSNRYFSAMKKEGWKTTRGMIYITYGEPDEVDDHPFELAEKPYQVWSYYRLNPPRKFIFVDRWGDGNYELQPPYNGLDWRDE